MSDLQVSKGGTLILLYSWCNENSYDRKRLLIFIFQFQPLHNAHHHKMPN